MRKPGSERCQAGHRLAPGKDKATCREYKFVKENRVSIQFMNCKSIRGTRLSTGRSPRQHRLAHWLLTAPLLTALGCSTLGDGSFGRLAWPHSRSPVATSVESFPESNSSFEERPQAAGLTAEYGMQRQAAQPTIEEVTINSTPASATLAEVVPAAYTEPLVAIVAPECQDVQYCGPGCVGGCRGECANGSSDNPYRMNAQEYVFDGGDQQPTVIIREDWSSEGIDPTDTVAYYETEDGLVCVKPTNRVPIYAPRFGAVRQVRGAMLAERSVGAQRILAPVAPGRFDELDLAGTVMQPVAPLGEEQVKLIDAFQENKAGTPVEQVLPPQRMSEARVPFENIDVLAIGRITDEEIAVLGQFLQNARTWFKPELLEVLVNGQETSLLSKVKSPQDVLVYEPPGDKCALRICKTASHTIADSGDTIRFTIRFDNAGVTQIRNAVILDSLSPRLEYIDGSQQSSVEVRFTTEPNEVGSQILKWEITSPMEPNEGGAISFDCLVR
jgi:uncharacterized repeat protein (TIGR01451 family)